MPLTMALASPAIAGAGVETPQVRFLELHASAGVGAGGGLVGLSSPGLTSTLEVRLGWLGLPEVRATLLPSVVAWDGPLVLVPAQVDAIWMAPLVPRRVGLQAGMWTIPQIEGWFDERWGFWPKAVHAGVAYVHEKDVSFDAFFGLQAATWSDAGGTYPDVKVRWTWPSRVYVSAEVSPAHCGVQAGVLLGRP